MLMMKTQNHDGHDDVNVLETTTTEDDADDGVAQNPVNKII